MWVVLLLSVFALGLSDPANKTVERTASLVVLPPLVLGYEDLYDDSANDYFTSAKAPPENDDHNIDDAENIEEVDVEQKGANIDDKADGKNVDEQTNELRTGSKLNPRTRGHQKSRSVPRS